MTRLLKAGPNGLLPEQNIQEVAAAVREGALVAFPTDTVYGIGTHGLLPEACRRIYALKHRDSRKPLPILVHSMDEARRWALLDGPAGILAGRFWPGPLTLALRPTPEGRRLLLPGLPTLALRIPDHALTRCLIEASGVPWASTSANLSGTPPLADGKEVAAGFQDQVDVIIDGGRCPGTSSTVVDVSEGKVRILREGAIDRSRILQSTTG